MKILKFTFLTVLFSIVLLPAFAQQQDTIGIRSIIARQGKFAESYPVEKVYLHTDKSYYATGDTIWFKAYVTVDLHQPTILSKIVYVDIISNTDTLMQSLRLPVINGFAQGNIALDPAVFKQGNYRLRAYTNWMRNFDPAYFFSKNIPVANSDKQINVRAIFTAAGKGRGNGTEARLIYKDPEGNPYSNKKVSWYVETIEKSLGKGKGTTDQNGVFRISIPPAKSADDGPSTLVAAIDVDPDNKKPVTNSFTVQAPANKTNDVQFFPEGGKLIAGNDVRVAFKAIRPDGLGVEVKGAVTDNEGKAVTTFTSQHVGMGEFLLLSESGKSYKATVTFPDGSQQTYPLPAVEQSGIALAVNSSNPNMVGIRVLANQAYLDQNQGKLYYIIAKIGENVCYAAQTALRDKTYDVTIPKTKLTSGILQITLINDHGQPISERLSFIQNNDLLNLAVHTDRTSYGRRQKVQLNLAAKNQQQPAEANFSVAVIDENIAPSDESDEASILSYLLLSSDVKGYIEKPGYYFNHPTEKSKADLDLLMLTQGYRRFSYTDLVANRMPQLRYLPEQGIDVTGTLRTANGMPVNKGSVQLTIADRHYTRGTITDANGAFKFSNIPLIDSSKVVISARGNYHSNDMMLIIDGVTMPTTVANNTAPDMVADIDSTYRSYIKNSKQQYTNTHMLKEVVITAKPVVKLPSHADYPALSGLSPIPDHVIPADRLTGCNNVLICLQTAALGLTYRDDNFYVLRDYNAGKRTPVQIFVNGSPVDVSFLSSLAPSDVLSAEIFLKDDLGLVDRVYNSDGVLAINTKSAALKTMAKTKMSIEDLKNMLPRNDEVTITPQGYSIARQFYTPKYDAAKPVTVATDLRSTIYWNPQLKTDKTTGAATVEFYNADGRGNYRAIIEGMDAEGHLGRVVYRYKVE